MFKKFTNGCVHLVNRFLPDPFIFCIVLTVIVFIAAIPATGASPMQVVGGWGAGIPMQVVGGWGAGIWSLLSFTSQMILVLVLGTALANAPVVKRLVERIASVAKSPFQGIVIVTFVSLIACWINWGFGLVVGAILSTTDFSSRPHIPDSLSGMRDFQVPFRWRWQHRAKKLSLPQRAEQYPRRFLRPRQSLHLITF